MGLFLEFDELQPEAQVMLATQSGGNLIGRAVAGGGGGGLAVSAIGVDPNVSHVFNGDGSGGAILLPAPITIVFCEDAITTGITFKLDEQGPIEDGWIVAFSITGEPPAEITINGEVDNNLLIINEAATANPVNNLPFAIFYWFGGWTQLRCDIHTSLLAAAARNRRTPRR